MSKPRIWQLQTAKNRFSEVVDRAGSEGPQVVTRRGRESPLGRAPAFTRRLKACRTRPCDRQRLSGELEPFDAASFRRDVPALLFARNGADRRNGTRPSFGVGRYERKVRFRRVEALTRSRVLGLDTASDFHA